MTVAGFHVFWDFSIILSPGFNAGKGFAFMTDGSMILGKRRHCVMGRRGGSWLSGPSAFVKEMLVRH